MAARGRGGGFKVSSLYSFACGCRSVQSANPGPSAHAFGREVLVGAADGRSSYPPNKVSTTKYTLLSFVPKSLFEQFRRVANFYFLVVACLEYTAVAPYSGGSAMLPLVVVIAATMAKEAFEDWRRAQQDIEVNNRRVLVHAGRAFTETKWRRLKVGDIVKVRRDEFFPADLVFLSSSYEDGICYVETANLDGETNLKLKQALAATLMLRNDADFSGFNAVIQCDPPNDKLYTFGGKIKINEQEEVFSQKAQQLLLRDSKLRNTDYVYGAVVFTGSDTKVRQNSTPPPSKRSRIEKNMDKLIYLLLGFLVVISVIGSTVFGIDTANELKDGSVIQWYLQPNSSAVFFDSKQPFAASVLHFIGAMMLYGYFIPISLYVSIEIVKILQALFISQDIKMYHEETDTPVRARTSNLNEEFGQVSTILSDKTGTLTCNSMDFVKCSIAGVAYGEGPSRMGSSIKGFNFWDERITEGKWAMEPQAGCIEKFFRLLAICHTCIPEVDKQSGIVSYKAESPDEAAFVVAASELGFKFYERTQTTIKLQEGAKERSYKLLNSLDFTPSRKRMSVIVRDEEGRILLLSKGADNVIFERLRHHAVEYEEVTKEHINKYAADGLRTLVLAYRELSEAEYVSFNGEFTAASSMLGPNREELSEAAAERVERELTLLGATAVEDKLQKGVPECIKKLSEAGIKIWVLTGDKMETAINIGYACNLLRHGMTQIKISLDSKEMAGDKPDMREILNELVERHKNSEMGTLALIIDGSALEFALEDDISTQFLDLARYCVSVICCRASPKQKALVTKLVKSYTGEITLAVGDGANDVGMLQEADIGVGISGAEGMQAAMASDVSIAQFRFLERLLLVHGHWCYRRISTMICYFFYKNFVFGFTLFIFDAYTLFSSQAAYNDWAMAFYNVLFSSLPVIALGVLDQDVSPEYCLKYPKLYQEGPKNLLFRWPQILGWMLYGAIQAVAIFFLVNVSLRLHAFRGDGATADYETFGLLLYTCVVWIVNCQLALSMRYFTLIQHILIWGSIILWYLFLMTYGSLPPTISTTTYSVFLEELASALPYWLVTLAVSLIALLPYFAYSAVKEEFFPSDADMILRDQRSGSGNLEAGPELRQLSSRSARVGGSSRRESVLSASGRVHHAEDCSADAAAACGTSLVL